MKSRKFFLSVFVAATLSFLAACAGASGSGTTNNGGGTPPPPPTATITANPASIMQGQSTTLTWQTTNASSVNITGVGAVQANGSTTVTPTQTTTYQLTASGAGGSQTASTQVTVNAPPPPPPGDIHSVNHILIMFQENRAFDEYFGQMTAYRQRNAIPINSADGKIFDLSDPAAQVAESKNVGANGQVILSYHTGSVCTENLTPDWLESHHEMNRLGSDYGPTSPMDGFASVAGNLGKSVPAVLDKDGHRAMGYFDDTDFNFYYFMASQFAMSDMLFSPIPTRTTSNRMYIHAATSAGTVHADENHAGGFKSKTIWRALDEKGVSWKIYISDSTIGNTFTFFDLFTDSGDPTRKAKIVPIDDYFTDVAAGTLPQVAFIETGMATGRDEHPSNNVDPNLPAPKINVQNGAAWVAQVINALVHSPSWKDSVFFWAFDEGGGAFDHVPPINVPNPDGIQPNDLCGIDVVCTGGKVDVPGDFTITGFRVPNMIISPFSKKNYVSHTPMDYTAFLKFIETRFGLAPLTARDASMPDMTEFFDFTNGGPWATPPVNIPAQDRTGVCDFSKE